jgi:hypothetical protein
MSKPIVCLIALVMLVPLLLWGPSDPAEAG